MSDHQQFTAIVYFHGIGQQSRYEELSRLLESFDDYAVVQADDRLEQLEVGVEASRTDITDNNIGYVSFKRGDKEFRFYEVYWAPITASGTTARSVFSWLIGHMTTPLKILNSGWHSRRRLRISYLYALWYNNNPKGKEFLTLRNLINHYNDFCDFALREYKLKGTFNDFLAYLNNKADADESQKLIALAKQWRQYVHRTERHKLFILTTIIYIVAVIPLLTLSRVIYLFGTGFSNELGVRFSDLFRFVIPLMESPLTWQDIMQNDPTTILFYMLITILLPLPWILAGFLRNYGGDVQLWATYQETNEKYNKRKEILKRGLESTTHVLNHENCERVLLIGHSLGTTIAYDTLLSIGRHNRAIEAALADNPKKLKPPTTSNFSQGSNVPLAINLSDSGQPIKTDKIQYFVTMGSPIDTIHYFFESKQGKYRPYELIVDDIRGDIGSPPFVLGDGHPNFRWINFWSQEDYFSAPLYTPNPRVYTRTEQDVDNVLIKSYDFPSPARSHVGYFRHNAVIGVLYRLIFRRDDPQSSRALQQLLDSKPKVSAQRLLDLMLLGTWSLLFTIVFDMLGWNLLQRIFSYIFFGFIVILTISIILSAIRGALHPFKPWTDKDASA
ncbi:MAG: hypothetical protein WBC91_06805 [Phototrophicaceae bacterium]